MVKDPELLPLFEQLRSLLAPYGDRFVVRHDQPGYYDLHTPTPVAFQGHHKRETLFAAVIVQKGYVGLYMTLAYIAPDLYGSDLTALLRGKSCFHIRSLSPSLRSQVAEVLERGYRLYVERGWIEG